MKALPKKIFVKTEKERDGTEYFVADANAFNLVEMGEKVRVGTYQLVEISEAQGVASFSKPRKR